MLFGGVVDQYIDMVEIFDCFVYQFGNEIWIVDIVGYQFVVGVGFGYCSVCVFGIFMFIEIGNDYVGFFFGEVDCC